MLFNSIFSALESYPFTMDSVYSLPSSTRSSFAHNCRQIPTVSARRTAHSRRSTSWYTAGSGLGSRRAMQCSRATTPNDGRSTDDRRLSASIWVHVGVRVQQVPQSFVGICLSRFCLFAHRSEPFRMRASAYMDMLHKSQVAREQTPQSQYTEWIRYDWMANMADCSSRASVGHGDLDNVEMLMALHFLKDKVKPKTLISRICGQFSMGYMTYNARRQQFWWEVIYFDHSWWEVWKFMSTRRKSRKKIM